MQAKQVVEQKKVYVVAWRHGLDILTEAILPSKLNWKRLSWTSTMKFVISYDLTPTSWLQIALGLYESKSALQSISRSMLQLQQASVLRSIAVPLILDCRLCSHCICNSTKSSQNSTLPFGIYRRTSENYSKWKLMHNQDQTKTLNYPRQEWRGRSFCHLVFTVIHRPSSSRDTQQLRLLGYKDRSTKESRVK